jgi:hypothetical protein
MMLIENHRTDDGYVYHATSMIVGVRIASYDAGSGITVLIDLADGKTHGGYRRRRS